MSLATRHRGTIDSADSRKVPLLSGKPDPLMPLSDNLTTPPDPSGRPHCLGDDEELFGFDKIGRETRGVVRQST